MRTSLALGSTGKERLGLPLLPLPATKHAAARQRLRFQASSSPCAVDGPTRRAPRRCPAWTPEGLGWLDDSMLARGLPWLLLAFARKLFVTLDPYAGGESCCQ